MARSSNWRTTIEWATLSGSYATLPRAQGFVLKSGNGQVISRAIAASMGANDVILPTGGSPSLTGLSFELRHVASGGILPYLYRAAGVLTPIKFRINNPNDSWELFGAYNTQNSLNWAPDNTGTITVSADFIGTSLATTSCATASAEGTGAIYQWYDGQVGINSASFEVIQAAYTMNHNIQGLFSLDGATTTYPHAIHVDTVPTIEGSLTARVSTTSFTEPGLLSRSVFNIVIKATRAGTTTTSYQWLFSSASMNDVDVINHGGPSDDPMVFNLPFIVPSGNFSFSVV